MSRDEVRSMIQLRHLVDELRKTLDTADATPEQIRHKIDNLIEAGVLPGANRSNVVHWQFVNGVTTQSPTFEEHCQVALTYLTELDQRPKET